MGADVIIEGLAELEDRLSLLPEEMAQQILVPTLQEAGERLKVHIEASARATFQAYTGRLFRGIDVEFSEKGQGSRGVLLKVKIGTRTAPGAEFPFYARFWEKGFEHVGSAKRGRLGRERRGQAFLRQGKLQKGRRGVGEARDRAAGKFMRKRFMEPVWEARKGQAFEFIRKRLTEKLDQVVQFVRRGPERKAA